MQVGAEGQRTAADDHASSIWLPTWGADHGLEKSRRCRDAGASGENRAAELYMQPARADGCAATSGGHSHLGAEPAIAEPETLWNSGDCALQAPCLPTAHVAKPLPLFRRPPYHLMLSLCGPALWGDLTALHSKVRGSPGPRDIPGWLCPLDLEQT